MSLQAPLFYLIPDETAQVARAAFPNGNRYMRMRDTLGPIYSNPLFASLYPRDGQPAQAPAQLALVCVMQFAEGLSDRQAADAVRARIDWKYALALDLTDPGFDASVLCDFRDRLIAGSAELLLFETMLTLFREAGLLKLRGRQRTDATHVLAAIHVLNRLECIGETLRHALNSLASLAPDWLRKWVPSEWFDRSSRRFEEFRLPDSKVDRYALAALIGTDGRDLLEHVYAPDAPPALVMLPAMQTLRQVWLQQFYATPSPQPLTWRSADDLPPAPLLICSPYDIEARFSKKRETNWTGYKVHLTEICEQDTPHLVTNVETVVATSADVTITTTIHEHLAERDLTPSEHIVDAGYMSADNLLESNKAHIDLIGRMPPEPGWRAKEDNGYAASCFEVDWQAERATCPQGKQSVSWKLQLDHEKQPSVAIRFARADCKECAVREKCVGTAKAARSLLVHTREQYEALQAARKRQHSEDFQALYKQRAGIEGTISQGVRTSDLRRTRYIGLAKTRLLHLLVATALNFLRVAEWLADVPRAQTRHSAFAKLAPAPI